MVIKFDLDKHGIYKSTIDYDYKILLDNDIMLYFAYRSDKRCRLQVKKAIENIKQSPYEILDILHKNKLDIVLVEYSNLFKAYVIDDYKKINRYNEKNNHIL